MFLYPPVHVQSPTYCGKSGKSGGGGKGGKSCSSSWSSSSWDRGATKIFPPKVRTDPSPPDNNLDVSSWGEALGEDTDTEDVPVHLFEVDTIRKEETTNSLLDGGTEPSLEPPSPLEEPLLNSEESSSQPKVMERYSSLTSEEEGDFFGSVYFNRVKVRSIAPQKIYKDIAANEQEDNAQKLYQRIWYKLPFKPAWELFVWGSMNTTGCCRKDSGFSDFSCFHKLWFVVARTLKICINLLCLYVAIIACGATIQRSVTKTRLPYSIDHTYSKFVYEKKMHMYLFALFDY